MDRLQQLEALVFALCYVQGINDGKNIWETVSAATIAVGKLRRLGPHLEAHPLGPNELCYKDGEVTYRTQDIVPLLLELLGRSPAQDFGGGFPTPFV